MIQYKKHHSDSKKLSNFNSFFYSNRLIKIEKEIFALAIDFFEKTNVYLK